MTHSGEPPFSSMTRKNFFQPSSRLFVSPGRPAQGATTSLGDGDTASPPTASGTSRGTGRPAQGATIFLDEIFSQEYPSREMSDTLPGVQQGATIFFDEIFSQENPSREMVVDTLRGATIFPDEIFSQENPSRLFVAPGVRRREPRPASVMATHPPHRPSAGLVVSLGRPAQGCTAISV